jgi:Arc/MetJ-type ribon-helix-helix transcriptional regulator
MLSKQYETAIDDAIETFVGKYDVPSEFIADLRTLLIASGQKHITAAPEHKVTSGGAKAPRKKTSYNIYIKSMFSQSKDDGDTRNSQEKMSEFSKQWKTLSDEEKKKYTELAVTQNDHTNDSTKGAGPKRALTGYNLFYRENKDAIKESLQDDEKFMQKVGVTWKNLSPEEQKEYNERAKQESA